LSLCFWMAVSIPITFIVLDAERFCFLISLWDLAILILGTVASCCQLRRLTKSRGQES
jgi:hypothetical protein